LPSIRKNCKEEGERREGDDGQTENESVGVKKGKRAEVKEGKIWNGRI
jgi:hypothetical protein